MSYSLPREIADLIASWPAFRMGVRRIGVQLSDGRCFDNVMVAGRDVVGVLGMESVPFDAAAIVSATDQTDEPLPLDY